MALARQNEVPVFNLGTQKRSQTAYLEIAKRLSQVFAKTGYPVTNVQCLTSDGYWLLPDEYFSGSYHSYRDGGKLTHTGYHFLDIVPWLMRHGGAKNISHAWITAQLFRPDDSLGVMSPEELRERMMPDYTVQEVVPQAGFGDINSNILIRFCDPQGRERCSVTFSMLHEGFSLRTSVNQKEATEGRTKIDSLSVFQGPVFWAGLRRIAKMLPGTVVSTNMIGAFDHHELTFSANSVLTGLPALEIINPSSLSEGRVTVYGSQFTCENDLSPTLNFLQQVTGRTTGGFSPVRDHSIGIKLLSAAYESSALSLQEGDGRPVAVKRTFDESEWVEPPSGF